MAYNAGRITSFKQLRTWQKARESAASIYKVSESFPSGLTSKITSSVASVVANIAERFSRAGQKDKVRFYTTALESPTEKLSHTYIGTNLNFVKPEGLGIIEEKVEVLHKMTNGLIKKASGRSA